MNSPQRSLELAIAHGDTAETRMLLDGYPELLDNRFEENIGLTPLMWACRNRHITIVELLLERGASVRETNFREVNGDGGNSPLWFTAQGPLPGAVPIARLLTQAGAEIDQTGEHGTTAFFMAVSWVNMELVQFLLSCGATPFIKNHRGLTALESLQRDFLWSESQDKPDDDMKRLVLRAPRMIAFLKSIEAQSGSYGVPYLLLFSEIKIRHLRSR